jgi:hypothetical protein
MNPTTVDDCRMPIAAEKTEAAAAAVAAMAQGNAALDPGVALLRLDQRIPIFAGKLRSLPEVREAAGI